MRYIYLPTEEKAVASSILFLYSIRTRFSRFVDCLIAMETSCQEPIQIDTFSLADAHGTWLLREMLYAAKDLLDYWILRRMIRFAWYVVFGDDFWGIYEHKISWNRLHKIAP